MIYNWQHHDYQHLAASFQQGRLSALLLDGAKHSGYGELIQELVKFMLCLEPQANQACGKCSSCTLFELDNHPDYYVLTGESDEKKTAPIKVEQVRQVIEFAATSAHAANLKVIYLPDANQLNLNSANALLKILEEPPPQCRFILYASNKNRILPTIRSRCVDFRLSTPSVSVAAQVVGELENKDFWLNYYDGEPFFVVPFTTEQFNCLLNCLLRPSIDNIFAVSKNLDPKKIGMAQLLDFIFKWLADLLALQQLAQANYFSAHQEQIKALLLRLNLDELFQFNQELVFLREWSEHPLNQKLQLEALLFKYQQLFK